jgi:hypothetical protein
LNPCESVAYSLFVHQEKLATEGRGFTRITSPGTGFASIRTNGNRVAIRNVYGADGKAPGVQVRSGSCGFVAQSVLPPLSCRAPYFMYTLDVGAPLEVLL